MGKQRSSEWRHFHWHVVCDRLMWWIQMLGVSVSLARGWGRIKGLMAGRVGLTQGSCSSPQLYGCTLHDLRLKTPALASWSPYCTVDGWQGITCLPTRGCSLPPVSILTHFKVLSAPRHILYVCIPIFVQASCSICWISLGKAVQHGAHSPLWQSWASAAWSRTGFLGNASYHSGLTQSLASGQDVIYTLPLHLVRSGWI